MANVIVIGDSHQDTEFIKKVLKQENNASGADKILFLGDYFDTKKDNVAGAKETSEYLMSLDKEFGDKILWIAGNHCLPYYYDIHFLRQNKKVRVNPFYNGSYSRTKARKISKVLTDEFISKQKLAHVVDNVLYTHAGATPDLIPTNLDENEKVYFDISGFLDECDRVMKNFAYEPNHPFFRVGKIRGGSSKTGGLIWCDGTYEFWTTLDMPFLIFAHTPQYIVPNILNNYLNLDFRQTRYAIVKDGAEIILKSTEGEAEKTFQIK